MVPVLKELRVTPQRVDRVEHNDDIDDKLLELMQGADFAIVDLTYARPSAYYEAGWMTGASKIVIYTVRRDHLRQCDDDPLGSEAVHFDLKMRNIIGWTEPNAGFRAHLKRRIMRAVRPLVERKRKETALEQERKAFLQKAPVQRHEVLAKTLARLVKADGFQMIEDGFDYFGPGSRWVRRIGRSSLVLNCFVEPKMGRELGSAVWSSRRSDPEHRELRVRKLTAAKSRAKAKIVDSVFVFFFENPITRKSFRKRFAQFGERDDGILFWGNGRDGGQDPFWVRTRTVVLIDGIFSERVLADQFVPKLKGLMRESRDREKAHAS